MFTSNSNGSHPSCKKAALEYVAAGFPVTICDGKNPGPIMGKRWQNRRLNEDEIQAMFKKHPNANVGVILGVTSGIIDLECDSKQAEADFARLFHGVDPPMTPTYQSRRGKHRLFAYERELERVGKAKFHYGELEILAGVNSKGTQTLLPPSTTDGFTREWLVSTDECAPARLPEEVIRRLLRVGTSVTQGTQGTQGTQARPVDSVSPMLHVQLSELPTDKAVEVAICACIPDRPARRHDMVFRLARCLRAIPAFADATAKEMRHIVLQWYQRSQKYYRSGWETVWGDFCESWEAVHTPFGQGGLESALARAKAASTPDFCAGLGYVDPRFVLLVKLCRELSLLRDDRQFFLSSHKAAALLDAGSHVTVHRWLTSTLCADGILRKVASGDRKKMEANTYQYLRD